MDAELFDPSDITWEIAPSKRNDRVTIVLKSEGSFNLMKIYLGLKMIAEKIELELNILEQASDEEH